MVTTVNEFISASVSDRGLNETRPQNEDSFLEMAQHGLFAVADGVGGAQAGEVASQMAVEILGEAFVNMGANADPEEVMRIALDRANEAIFQMSQDLPQLSSMATTIAALHVSGDMATIAHVGDSRVYRLDGGGRLFRETDDHSVVEEEVRAGRLTPEQALNHPSRNVISRALGAENTVEPDIKCVLIHPATTFLLCSDGITRHISDEEIESLLNSDFGPADACARMKEICFSRGAEDNLTAVVISFPGERSQRVDSPDDDEGIEEVTLASIREPAAMEFEETVESLPQNGFVQSEAVDEEQPRQEPSDEPHEAEARSGEASDDDEPLIESSEQLHSEEPAAEPAPETDYTIPERVVKLEPAALPTAAPYDYRQEPKSPPAISGVLPMIGTLLAGAIIGLAGGYYLFTNTAPAAPAPQISEQKSNNVPLTSFEETRRLVDADPVRYLNANAATPQKADDFFWLGRALLLTGKPVEAKRAFEEARRLLPAVQETSNIKTMSNEIAMALAIVENEQAVQAFARQIAAQNAAGIANSNSNVIGLPAR